MFTPGGVGMPEKDKGRMYIKAAIRLGAKRDHHLPIMHHFQVIYSRGRMRNGRTSGV